MQYFHFSLPAFHSPEMNMGNETIQAVRGMNDILPDEAGLWLWFEEVVRDWLDSYGYRNIRMLRCSSAPSER
jgi:hypothetical protein